MSTVIFILVYGISYGLILCLVSIGLVITMGLMRVINIAHGAFAASRRVFLREPGRQVRVTVSRGGRGCRRIGRRAQSRSERLFFVHAVR